MQVNERLEQGSKAFLPVALVRLFGVILCLLQRFERLRQLP